MKMKFLMVLVLSLVLIFASAGCVGNDTKVQINESLGEFNKISITGVSELKLVSSDTSRINIEVGQKNAQYVKYEVVNGTLEITADRKVPSDQDTEITVWYKDLNEITISGVHDAEAELPITGSNLVVTSDGTNSIDLNVQVENLTLNITGVNDVDMKGSAKTVMVKVDGTSDLDLEELAAADMTVAMKGVSNMDVYVTNSLNATLNGTCKLTYAGNPPQVVSNVSETSVIVKKN
ncbi:head GIN domain-containing protein [Methanolapillus millepedarum]|uniref:Putative auto-transporter adhesin head GIN domain-containing protein n=1 Tax=Methanolapillus millepedarum TaxID=3028296 RepID=A0AA96ZUT1_9EURY|nr:hypothetical protein MsAc7_01900 [Methanosarcinaceae archaeon Ac7]